MRNMLKRLYLETFQTKNKMHVYFYLRGLAPFVERAKSFLRGQFWQMHTIEKASGKEKPVIVQGGLRESVLGVQEYIIPETSLPEFLAMCGITSPHKIGVSSKKALHKFKLSGLRKMIGCKKIPKNVFKQAQDIDVDVVVSGKERCLAGLPSNNMSIHLIGIKGDKYGSTDGEHYHELL